MSKSHIDELNLTISGLEGKQSDLLKKRKNYMENLRKLSKEAVNLGFQFFISCFYFVLE